MAATSPTNAGSGLSSLRVTALTSSASSRGECPESVLARTRGCSRVSNYSVEQRREEFRMLVCDLLKDHSRKTARELHYELQVRDVWLSTHEVLTAILNDKLLLSRVDVEYRSQGRWNHIMFSLKSR